MILPVGEMAFLRVHRNDESLLRVKRQWVNSGRCKYELHE